MKLFFPEIQLQKIFPSRLALALSILLPFSIFAQQDSLILKYTDKSGQVNIDSVLSNGKSFIYSNPDRASKIADQLIQIAEKQRDPMGIANAYRFLGAYYADVKFDFKSAHQNYKTADSIYLKLDTPKARIAHGIVTHNYGVLKQQQGDYPAAIEFYTDALRIFEDTQNLTTKVKTLNNLAILYAYVFENEKAERYAREATKLAKKNKDELMVASGTLALVSILVDQKQFKEAIPLLEEMKKIADKNNFEHHIILYHYNYGVYHAYTEENEKAISDFKQAIQLAESTSNEWEIMRAKLSLAETYLVNQQVEEAHQSALEALDKAKVLESKDSEERLLSLLALIYEKKSDFRSAFQHLNSAYHLRDTLFNEDNQRQIAFLETVYQTEKKEFKIQTLENERKWYTWLAIAAVLILLTALAFALIQYRLAIIKKKLAEKENQRLEKEKQLFATQALLQGQEDERSRMAKELHDGLGGLLSGVKLNLNTMQRKLIITEEDGAAFEKSVHLLDESISELRRVAHNLMPESILKFGLDGAINEFVQSMKNENLNIIYQSYHIENGLGKQLDISVYRIIQELVNNAIKHSGAKEILVQLRKDENLVILEVEDDGNGFKVNSIEKEKGMGLVGIRSRVDYWKGKLEIDSSDSGTAVHIEIPV